MVCVTDGLTSYVGFWIVKSLLQHGFTVRVTINHRLPLANSNIDAGESMISDLEELECKVSKVDAALLDCQSLEKAFGGCFAVIHTSSFVDPHGVSGFSATMAKVEEKAVENVIEACAKISSIRKVVVTSSAAALVWQRPPNPNSNTAIDENCWSDLDFCRQNKLWYALSKTSMERRAWKVADERGVKLVCINPAFLTGPAFATRNSTATIAYLKDVRNVAETHVWAVENTSSSGRYLCFDEQMNWNNEILGDHGLMLRLLSSSNGEQIYERNEWGRCLSNAKLQRSLSTITTKSNLHERN
eukprot:Gb_21074 [translate_table: standard]